MSQALTEILWFKELLSEIQDLSLNAANPKSVNRLQNYKAELVNRHEENVNKVQNGKSKVTNILTFNKDCRWKKYIYHKLSITKFYVKLKAGIARLPGQKCNYKYINRFPLWPRWNVRNQITPLLEKTRKRRTKYIVFFKAMDMKKQRTIDPW